MEKVLVCYIERERERKEGEEERGREGGRERKRYNISMGEGKVQLYNST